MSPSGVASERPPKRPRRSIETDDSRSGQAPRRKTACRTCRMRKVKCDASKPVCSLCKANGSECEYDNPTSDKLTLESATLSLHEKLDQLQVGIESLQQSGYSFGSSVPPPQLDSPVETSHHSATFREDVVTEPSRDFLEIPPHRSSADTVLTWDVFERRYQPNALIDSLFKSETNVDQSEEPDNEVFQVPGGLKPLNEERIPQLIDAFLQNVHTKNPILDVPPLVRHARRVATDGLGWDARSCLILVACALGSIARPFEAPTPVDANNATQELQSSADRTKDLQAAESCFVLACRRLGGLKHTILGAQCYFFSGVYLMYTLRPLLSWQYFTQSSILYQLAMKKSYGITTSTSTPPSQYSARSVSDKQRRLEQSLYWSCFKSESEFRVELPLPQSEIASYENPQMFPSPPSPAGTERESGQGTPRRSGSIVTTSTVPSFGSLPLVSSSPTQDTQSAEDLELRQHTKDLCNEEESWYYYLTEIALRRIGNRIVNSFFRQEPATWLNIKPLLGIAYELDAQISSWSANLPPAMQQWESNYTIRAPVKEQYPDGKSGIVSMELSWAIDNRLLEVKSWLYQPFLYYLIHSDVSKKHGKASAPGGYSFDPLLSSNDPVTSPMSVGYIASAGFSQHDAAVLRHLISSGIDCNIKVLDVRSIRHRHHGLWFDLRSLMCASLVLLGVVRSGHEALIPGGVHSLWGDDDAVSVDDHWQGRRSRHPIGGKIGHVLESFEYWAVEAPDMARHWEVLDDMTRSVQEWRAASLNA